MSATTRSLCCFALVVATVSVQAAGTESTSPYGQAGAPAAAATGGDLEFAAVSMMGGQTMVNLTSTRDQSSFWVPVGSTANGVTVLKYDNSQDQVTIRVNGIEKTLPLRPPSMVANAPMPSLPPAPAAAPAMSAGASTPAATPSVPETQAQKEEDARMLVSDLLEIGMVQRRAYQQALKKQQEQQAQQGAGAPPPQSTASASTASGTTTPPSSSAPASNPSGS